MTKTPRFYFFNPHPGYGGALLPIPEKVKAVADSINGKTLTMRAALRRFLDAAQRDGVYIDVSPKCVFAESEPKGSTKFPQHCWRAIQYRAVAPAVRRAAPLRAGAEGGSHE